MPQHRFAVLRADLTREQRLAEHLAVFDEFLRTLERET